MVKERRGLPVKRRVIVVGGGPAGMMAAGTAGRRGLDVTLIEKNERLGRKLLITGKGRCNITNDMDVEGLISNVPVNGKFLYSAFYTFSNDDLLNLFHDLGLATKVERGGRVFPASDKALDVVKALQKYITQNGVRVLHGEVEQVLAKEGQVYQVVLKDGSRLACEAVVVATGGVSYPLTGSTGDGYRFAEENGHTVTRLKPALVPLEVIEEWVTEVQGLALKNISISVYNNRNKQIYTDFGEMLFTHFGVSGPVILSASSHLDKPVEKEYRLVIDLKPALSPAELDERIQRDFAKYINKIYANALGDLLPKKLIPIIIHLSGIDPEKKVNQITKDEREKLGWILKNLTLTIKRFRPLSEAIITSGGVKVEEVNPSTMESKLVNGLFFTGEVLDVNAYTGGFNLQIAFSTGYLAGLNC
jgi:predicted Rossmann fold flavoprotein